jgi:acyl-CoA dehydrogenase
LTRDIFTPQDRDDPTGLLEETLAVVVSLEEVEKKLDKAIRAGKLRRYHGVDWFTEAVDAGVLDQGEAQRLREAEALVARVIAVDHFDPAEVQPKFKRPDGSSGASRAAEAAE